MDVFRHGPVPLRRGLALMCLGLGLALLIAAVPARATVRVWRAFAHPHVNFAYCLNYTEIADIRLLRYEGMSTLLDDYAGTLAKSGRLSPPRVDIQAGCSLFGGHPSVELSRSGRGYHLFVHGDPDLALLVRVIDYCASDSWRSFVYNPGKVEGDVAKRTFLSVLDREVGEADLTFFENREVEVHRTGELAAVYENREVRLYLSGNRLDVEPEGPLPVRLRDRYLVCGDGWLYLCHGGSARQRVRLAGFDGEPYYEADLAAYRNWANVTDAGAPVLTYSYRDDAFFRLDRDSGAWRMVEPEPVETNGTARFAGRGPGLVAGREIE